MSRLPTRPLYAIQERLIIEDAAILIRGRMRRLADGLRPHVEYRETGHDVSATNLGTMLKYLFHWVQRGEGNIDVAGSMLFEVKDQLDGRPHGDRGRVAEFEEHYVEDPATDLDRLLLAAWARIRLGREVPITARELAVLGGITSQALRGLVRDGEIAGSGAKPTRIAPDDARRWLRSRAVLGF